MYMRIVLTILLWQSEGGEIKVYNIGKCIELLDGI